MALSGKGDRFLARQKRRIDRRQEEILAAAASLFAGKGYAGTTIVEIADAVGLAEGTIYNYFPSKREILRAIAYETETPMEAVLMSAGGIQDRPALVSLVEQALEVPESRMSFLRVVFAEAWVDDSILQEFAAIRLGRIHRRLTALVAERVAAGLFRRVDPALTAELIIGMFAAVILPALRGTQQALDPERRRVAAEAIVNLMLDGLEGSAGGRA